MITFSGKNRRFSHLNYTVKTLWLLCTASMLLLLTACPKQKPQAATTVPCTASWYQAVESRISTGDGMGHGPDIGSEEWKSVIEFKLGIRGNPDVPDRNSSQWCDYIDKLL
jgi:hypothetical protein